MVKLSTIRPTKPKIKLNAAAKRKKFSRIPHGQDDIKKPFIKPPRLVKSPPRFNVTQLIRTVSKDRRELANDLAIKKYGTLVLPKNITNKIIPSDTKAYRIQTYSKHNKHIHNVSVFLVDGNPFNEHSKCLVDCSCADHVYRYEYNLAQKGNAFEWRCNGEAPTVYTNLSICKHTYLALKYMLRKNHEGTLVRKSRIEPKLSSSRGV